MSLHPLREKKNITPGLRPPLKFFWAPVAAGILIALLYFPLLDSVFYFLHGRESQGLLLAQALAEGKGFVDLSLPGHPAHVREPPVFYLMLAGLIWLFGLKLFPLKLFMWSSYVAAAVLATIFFQHRSRPLTAFLATALCFSSFELFRFFTGPKSDLPFVAVVFAGLLAMEKFRERLFGKDHQANSGRGESPRSDRRLILLAGLSVVLIITAIMIRSLGLALFFALAGGILFTGGGRITLGPRLRWLIVVSIPLLVVLGLWALRATNVKNPAGYNYLDWFLMDLAPDSPAMVAMDYHAPLMPPLPRASIGQLLHRAVHHLLLYPTLTFNMLFNLDLPSAPTSFFSQFLFFLALLSAFVIILLAERHSPFVLFFLTTYVLAILLWPMDDGRLLYPLLPFASYYIVMTTETLLLFAKVRFIKNKEKPKAEIKEKLLSEFPSAVLFLVIALLIGYHVKWDLQYAKALASLPTVKYRPGFEVRFVNREVMASYHLLAWAREQARPGTILMFHSPPPCRLFTGHECQSIPFSEDLAQVREFILQGGADYLLLDEWGRSFPQGPGQFTETVLRPLVARYPEDFSVVFQVPGTEAQVIRVQRK